MGAREVRIQVATGLDGGQEQADAEQAAASTETVGRTSTEELLGQANVNVNVRGCERKQERGNVSVSVVSPECDAIRVCYHL